MDWAVIIGGLVGPLIAQCFSKFSTEDPQEYLRAHYDAASGKLDPSVVRDAMNQTRRAIRKAHRSASRQDRKTMPRYSNQDIYDLTEQNLLKAMESPKSEVLAAFATAASLGDDE